MALKNKRQDNYPEWYQNIVAEADMAENSSSPGCMVIKPWGYGIWERIRDIMDEKIKATDHENCYFPMFIPLSFFQKEAEHVDGFAKEMAVVTHSRLSMKDGQVGAGFSFGRTADCPSDVGGDYCRLFFQMGQILSRSAGTD